MDSISCDIVILPSPSLAAAAITASQTLRQFDSLFVLKDGECFPHISLYMLQLQTVDLLKAEASLSAIAQACPVMYLHALRYASATGFVDAEYEKSPELIRLQDTVIRALNPIRDGMRKKDIERMRTAHGVALENFQTYGYKYVGELFRPHLTLSRFKNDNPRALEVLGQLSDFGGACLQLGIFEMGDNGTCVRKIKTFDLIA